MKQALAILLISLCVIDIQGKQNFLKRLNKLKYDGIQSTLPKHPRKMHSMDSNKVIASKSGPLQEYSWNTCSNSTNLVTINNLKVTPDPIPVPGHVTVEVDADLKQDLHSPISLDLTIEKDMGFWIKLPCKHNMGSCFYKDLCHMIPAVSKCPSVFKKHNIPCKCPVKAGHYAIPSTTIHIPPIHVPDELKNGDYRVHANWTSGKTQILCLEVHFSIGSGLQ